MAIPTFLRSFSVVTVAALAAAGAAAKDITVVNFGGANGNAQRAAFTQPFEKSTGHKVIAVEYNGEQAKVKAMVEAGRVTWDLVEVENGDIGRGCDEGLYEKIDYARLGVPKADLLPAAATECGVGFFIWSTVLAYDASRLKTAPRSWADFWDVKKTPGKRGMRKTPVGNLEFALIADGVPAQDVYGVLATKAGVDRAFRKLDELKPSIQWWEAGAQPPQLLIAGDVVMSTAYNGRIDAARREGRKLDIAWDGNLYDMDFWAIPKGSPNKDLALQYLGYTLATAQQASYSRNIAYGPTNQTALKQLDAKVLADLPNAPANSANAVMMNGQFWADHGEELNKRFTAWAAK